MNPRTKKLLRKAKFVRTLSWLTFIPVAGTLMLVFRYVLRYRVENLAHWRKMYRALNQNGRPLLICANHLTYLDSVVLIYAFSHHLRYFTRFRTLPWNLPAIEYFKNPFFALVGMTSKCLFIDRSGSKESHEALYDVAGTLLARGEVFTIFPEGRRSRTGMFDDRKLAYGIGKVVTRVPEVDVLCVYLRAKDQSRYSGFPKLGSRFLLRAEKLVVQPADSGRESVGQITQTIARKIQALEKQHFDCLSSTAG